LLIIPADSSLRPISRGIESSQNFFLKGYSLDVEERFRFVNLYVTDGTETVALQIPDEAAPTN
jgi:hypothetical protein